MPIKQTVPTNSGDSIQFGNATTPVAASITGAEISTGNGYLALNTANSGTVSEQVRVDKDGNVLLNNATSYLSVGANRSYFGYGSVLVSGGAATDTGILTGGNILFGTNAGAGNTERLRITSTGKIGVGNTNPSTSLDISSKTDALSLPSGTTAQRPSSPPNGSFRYNTTANTWESYNNGGWIPSNPNVVTNYQQFTTSGTFTPASGVRNIQLLVVGGGGGGTSGAGGGGAGGVVYIPNFAVTPSVGITVTIGSGGAANANGTNSSFGSITAYGGGRGGYLTDVSYGHINAAYSGASGGGSGATSTVVGSAAPASSQGSAGGIAPIASPFPAGGGGGAGQVGQNGASGVNGNGGNGIYIPIFASYGSSGYFGGGGAGGYTGNSSGTGGLGGGGNTATAGTANTGGGGGGGTGSGAAGGSGTVIVAWYQ